MNVAEFLKFLRDHPDHGVSFVLPDGSSVPAHFHITEVGHLAKSFIDCGGKRHSNESCLLQTWVADDTDHRLKASKLLDIFERAHGLLPSRELPVEIEHEAPVLTQLPLTRCEVTFEMLSFHTELKHTDCLAKDLCLPDFSMPAIPGQDNACTPGSGCC
ncbi:DUF6428 family protein [Haloferula rosea]|uniref:Uncharacterized protein n=1 Tax=Haloferula rosea TaxID=490093 RepID=A0A934R9T6_9BACT|nr:DUF6428 family protein [Haloferula rosea]MBK1826658.1 hypothetical protein [Haloferula rosea]